MGSEMCIRDSLGSVWSGVTKAGAFAGLLTGGGVYLVTYLGLINPDWFGSGFLQNIALWLQSESPNPYSCAAMGEIASIAVTIVVSKLTTPYPQKHIDALFSKTVPTD